jgi:hypothetical protein
MQMRRWNYHPLNRALRASELRRDGREAAKHGFPTIAEVCLGEAELLAPTPPIPPDGGEIPGAKRTKQGLTPRRGLRPGYRDANIASDPQKDRTTVNGSTPPPSTIAEGKSNGRGRENAEHKRYGPAGTNGAARRTRASRTVDRTHTGV